MTSTYRHLEQHNQSLKEQTSDLRTLLYLPRFTQFRPIFTLMFDFSKTLTTAYEQHVSLL